MDRIHRGQSCIKISFYTIILPWPLLKVITLVPPFRGYTPIISMNIPEPTCLQCSATVVRQYVISRYLWYLWYWYTYCIHIVILVYSRQEESVWKILSLFVSVKGFRIRWALGLCCVGFQVTKSALRPIQSESCNVLMSYFPLFVQFFLAMKQIERLQAPSPGLAQFHRSSQQW